jgi:hypothetical protein
MISLELAIDVNAPTSPKCSTFWGRIVSSMFMRVNSNCAHHVRPPLGCERAAQPLPCGTLSSWTVGPK